MKNDGYSLRSDNGMILRLIVRIEMSVTGRDVIDDSSFLIH